MKKSLLAAFAAAVIMLPLAASADTFTRSLALGSRGTDVLMLQTLLRAGGYLSVEPTGYFGSLTKLALMAFQKAHGLEQVGSAGPKTRMLLNQAVSNTSNVQTPPTPGGSTNVSTPPTTAATSATASTSASQSASAPTSSTNDPPHITLVSPASIIPRTSQQTTLSVTTDKPAYCKYGTQPGMALSSMTSFTYSGGTTHTSSFTNLAADALYVYYVRCADMSDHQSQELTVSFSVTGQ